MPRLDRYGTNRFDRGRRFFAEGERAARALSVALRWRLHEVPNVGHDHERMGEAAMRLLYPS